ncbi:MAG: M12 family metallopeptidase [Deltaproteobacteria bacterium]|nr:M12 family metallopeptidase [Deltaproteobacteria bacterium]
MRIGYVKPLGRPYQPVVYAAVNGLAIFQGCIILGTVAEMDAVVAAIKLQPLVLKIPDMDLQLLGAGIKGAKYRWDNKTIPYVIDPGFPNPNLIKDAIDHWRARTDIKFVDRDQTHQDYVRFSSVRDGCASSVGRQGGEQQVVLAPDCVTGNVIHEIGHTVGLWHEQSRSDRDKYIEILWDKISPTARHNFEQHIDDGIDLGSYDYKSIMHYPAIAFPMIPGQETIRPRQAGVEIGQREGLSEGDIAAVAKLYA